MCRHWLPLYIAQVAMAVGAAALGFYLVRHDVRGCAR